MGRKMNGWMDGLLVGGGGVVVVVVGMGCRCVMYVAIIWSFSYWHLLLLPSCSMLIPSYHSKHGGVSVWRTILVANEWAELQVSKPCDHTTMHDRLLFIYPSI